MYGVSKALRRTFDVAYTQRGLRDSREAQEAEIAMGMVQALLSLMPESDDLVTLFEEMHRVAYAAEGNSPRVRRLSDTYLRLQTVLEGCKHSVVSTDLMAVRQATAVLTMAAEAVPETEFEISGGDKISADFKGAVLTAHFETGMSLEITLAKGLDREQSDAWVIDGGIWMRNTVRPAINPTVYEVMEGRVGHETVATIAKYLKQLIPYCSERRVVAPTRPRQPLLLASNAG
ncbi:TPA: hypothetical protein ACKPYM_000765 [Stenotrophomonas maltophilia]